MNAYAGYLFDLDGTLVDTAPDINAALNHALTRHGGRPVDEALTRHWVGHGSRALVTEAIASQNLSGGLIEPLIAAFLDYYAANIANLSVPYPAVIRSLEALKSRGARLAVVTNKLTQLSTPLLDSLNLSGWFDLIVCGDTTAAPKPAPEPALHACSVLGLAPEEALFVGDSDTDVQCARAAGCPVVVVRDGYNHGIPADQLGADAVIESFSDLV